MISRWHGELKDLDLIALGPWKAARLQRLNLPSSLETLPVTRHVLQLCSHVASSNQAILVAPPGAGKTTAVPLYLANEAWAISKRILVLVPRRLAARGAAERMASLLGETVGETIGYRVRFDTKVSERTRIELLTEGIFTRMIAEDPTLEGVAAVLFDEFHERSLDADLGLALALESQEALCPDLRLIIMSATLDVEAISGLLPSAPHIEAHGRSFPVQTFYQERKGGDPLEPQVARLAENAVTAHDGDALLFLPVRREVERTADMLRGSATLDHAFEILTLHGGLAPKEQAYALQPPPHGRRRIVVATSIAQTSVTLPGVKIVVDCGLARRPTFNPSTGLTRLETVRVSQASADQRRGRAGRTAPGVCYRLWNELQTKSLPTHDAPEILQADLVPLLLTLAGLGIAAADQLSWIDPPPEAAQKAALDLLRQLSLIDGDDRITPEGRAAERLPVHPRFAHMIAKAAQSGDAQTASEIAVLASEQGLGGEALDLSERLQIFRSNKSARASAARAQAKRWAQSARQAAGGKDKSLSLGQLAALAYPDRIAQNRAQSTGGKATGGKEGGFLLANGTGAAIDLRHSFARLPWLVALEIGGGTASNPIIRLAAEISEDEIRQTWPSHLAQVRKVSVDAPNTSATATTCETFGALTLSKRRDDLRPGEAESALLAFVRRQGLPALAWPDADNGLRPRLSLLHRHIGEPWPNVDDAALMDTLEDWLGPFLAGRTRLNALSSKTLDTALLTHVPYALHHDLDRLAPARYEAPSGRSIAIDYTAEAGPTVRCRVQDLFGLTDHPSLIEGQVPLVFELLSPANRPFQTTSDIAGFWRGSWADARRDMKSRYPKHDWPENPETAQPKLRSTKS